MVVFRQALEARLSRLEKRLKVPSKERHKCIGRLNKAPELKITGERIWKHRGVALDKTGKINNKAIVPISVQIQGEEAVQKHLDQMKVCGILFTTLTTSLKTSLQGKHEERKVDR